MLISAEHTPTLTVANVTARSRSNVRLVYYSLANSPDGSCEQQWIQSIRSLRRYNRSIPVWLFLFNHGSGELLREAERQNVQVQFLGDYCEFLQRAHPRGSILALYPTLHKFLVLPNLPLQPLTQLLFLDCDTFFFDDVSLLFDASGTHDWYAREEPRSLRSPHAHNPKHIDELLLKYITDKEALRSVLPFNTGVCLMNHGIWQKLAGLRCAFLDFAWRFLCGQELSGHKYELVDPGLRPAVLDALTDQDRSRALPYPSENPWILDEIALWLSLGHVPHFSLGTFSFEQVAQGGEFEPMLASPQRSILAHYFSGGEEEFFASVPSIAA